MEPELDKHVKGSDAAKVLATIGDRALADLESRAGAGETAISIETFGLHAENDPLSNQAASLKYTIAVGRAFIALLRGEFPQEMNPAPFVKADALIRHPQRTEQQARDGGFTYR
jgi:hypothetical protein